MKFIERLLLKFGLVTVSRFDCAYIDGLEEGYRRADLERTGSEHDGDDDE